MKNYDLTQPEYKGATALWVAGFVAADGGGFEWRITREEAEAVRDQWLQRGDCRVSDAQLVFLGDIGFGPGERNADEITNELDQRPELWEPKAEWSGSPDPANPDNFWIDDETGERVCAHTGKRYAAIVHCSPA